MTESMLDKRLEAERIHNLAKEDLGLVPLIHSKTFIIACIPAYNEEASIAKVVLGVRSYVDQVIVCDDGSYDSTGEIAEALGASVLKHERNMGYGAALISLFKEAKRLGADYVVTLDSDGQHDPGEIPILLDGIKNGDVDIVIGSRFLEGGGSNAPGWRKFGIKAINSLSQSGYNLSDTQSGFRAYTRKAIQSLALTEDGMGLSTEILAKSREKGLTIAEVPIHVVYSGDTSSQNPLSHGVDVSLNTLKHLSIHRPLLFYGVPGMASILISLVFWVVSLDSLRLYGTISTNVFLFAIGSTLIGLMLITTAMILWVISSLIKENSNSV